MKTHRALWKEKSHAQETEVAGEQRPEGRKRRGGAGKERVGLLSHLAHLWYVDLSLCLGYIPQRQRPRGETEVPHCSGVCVWGGGLTHLSMRGYLGSQQGQQCPEFHNLIKK